MSAIEVSIRNTETKGQLSKLRSNGNVPAIIYGGSEKNQTITLTKKQVSTLIEKENFASNVITLKLDGSELKVLPREISFDTVSDEPIHIDFLRIVSGSNINLEIPVKFINNDKSPGLKRGGVLNIVRRKVELKCPTESIPKEIIVDLNELDIGASIKISSVNLPEKVMPTISDRDFVIATVGAQLLLKSQRSRLKQLRKDPKEKQRLHPKQRQTQKTIKAKHLTVTKKMEIKKRNKSLQQKKNNIYCKLQNFLCYY